MDEFRNALDRWADRIVAARTIAMAIIDARAGHMTPAEIAKLTEQATRGKALMARSSRAATRSTTVFDNFEATLTRFETGVEQVDQQEKALASQLTAMGNAGAIIDATFSDGADKRPPAGNGSGGAAPSPLAPTA